ncbi:MAG: peptide chain release factor N(5)-glutamine methyltransferase [Alphaproteobacteria bacterium]|nr:peptide chain release factor N(5)-glutamine methyltransferase [Alphaproteobacteria bacterium]
MHTLRDVYKNILQTLQNADIENADFEARYIIKERTNFTLSDLVTKPLTEITEEQYQNTQKDIRERLNRKPLSRIYGEREFWGLPFYVTNHTLDPRQDTETLIEVALKKFPNKNQPIQILDIGTGTGCIVISLLKEFPKANALATDISYNAIQCAQKNTKRHNVDPRINFICGSWIDFINKKFDLIVSNPPYISNQIITTLEPEVQNHDPILALDGGKDGLNPYKKLFPKIKSHLNQAGTALFEIGHDQEQDVMRLAEEAGFSQRCVHVDISTNPRVVEISCGDK